VQLRQVEAERLYYEQVDRLSDLAFENSGSLEPAAEALGLRVQSSDWFGREGGEGLLSSPKIVSTAFSEEVRGEGRNSEPIDIGPEHTAVVRVVAYEEPRPRAFDEVREEVRAQLLAQKTAAAARAHAEALLARGRSGAAMDVLAKEAGAHYEQVAALPRRGGEAPEEVARKAFTMPRPASGAASYGVADLGNGDVAVIALRGVTDGAQDAAAVPAANLRDALTAQAGTRDLVSYQAALRARAKLTFRPLAPESGRPLD
jgi:peptidyl-prolyl cis-trans isomerase D